MLCRSLSWIGCVGLAAPAAARAGPTGVVGLLSVGEAAEVADGVTGVLGAWAEPSRVAAAAAAAAAEAGVTREEGLRGGERGVVSAWSAAGLDDVQSVSCRRQSEEPSFLVHSLQAEGVRGGTVIDDG